MMAAHRRASILLVVLVALTGAIVPPLVEDHLEAGFCSADCPVQHPGAGVAILAIVPTHVVSPALVCGKPLARAADIVRANSASHDAPRAPPLA